MNLFKTRFFIFFTLVTVIIFGMAGCGNDKYSEQTYYGSKELIITNEQVWLRNYSANRVSQVHEKYNEKNYGITVLSEYVFNGYSEEIGSGTINGGKLSFTVDKPVDLLEWDELKVFFTIAENIGWKADIDDDTVKGTFILPVTNEDQYVLIREGVSGTTSSISDESVYFVYFDKDCIITGESSEDEQVMYTFNPFTLKLKKGWNTIWYKQTYTTSGKSSFSMNIKNPDLKWVLIPTVETK
jgi:hypothetical protein